MLGNLIENAAKYGGGSVFATVRGEAGVVEFRIEDDGLGIAEEDRAMPFDRGARLDSNKPGTGLGLAIVCDVAELYHGTVWLEVREALGGLLVLLRLPAARGSALFTLSSSVSFLGFPGSTGGTARQTRRAASRK